ncbi:MAG: hypothetical protein OMM_04095 [Candidatus Magnetoglobus multicellularis str. Araruama]|uniref:Uncharacterized protein n=1 Tax=Candidatus Magnetoglobus multicellularis str. Araruama TaxID=890399 RepID=A0A1V1P2R8_9BACT|nr:MAG: hypothetical protein OMM_04095 [Candidatus Magnetoglobus multicellularis str. Araruama]
MISLNDLSDAPYNLWIKLFSSKINQRLSVLKRILAIVVKKFNKGLVSILVKILNFWNMIGEITMQKIQNDILYDSGGISDEVASWFLSLFKPEDRLRGLKPEDVFKQFKTKDRLRGLKPEDRLHGLKPEDVFKQFKTKDRLQGLKPEDRLNGLDLKIIENYLEKQRKKKI